MGHRRGLVGSSGGLTCWKLNNHCPLKETGVVKGSNPSLSRTNRTTGSRTSGETCSLSC
jgi:hypothetical protein